jgi:hypothetical protein
LISETVTSEGADNEMRDSEEDAGEKRSRTVNVKFMCKKTPERRGPEQSM